LLSRAELKARSHFSVA